jgi:DNA excision repair protein ERCC-2
VVAFSATLKPFDFHLRTLGLNPETTFTEEFKSPFPADHRKILIIPQVSTKWRDRENNYGKIRDVIEKVAALRSGNYFVFFPSFDFLNRVADLTHPKGFRVVRQERDMNRRDVDRVLELLREAETPTIVFAVQGGVFSEGIDYPGRMIIGALIVGPALPTFDFEREELRRYFDQKGGPGFDYAYTFPAMTRVVQSAGRVIRSPEDRGVIILLDQRFVHENYLKAMPADWLASGREALLSKHILQDISDFWRSHDAE